MLGAIWALLKAAAVAIGWAKQAADQTTGATLQDDADKTEVLDEVTKAKAVDDAAAGVSVADRRKWLRANATAGDP